ncbi:MAG: phosphatidate cytidylyltransferase [bacterium]
MISQRIMVALFGIPLILFLIYLGSVPFLGLVLLIVALGLSEFYSLVQKHGYVPFKVIGVLTAMILVLSVYLNMDTKIFLTTFILLLFLMRLYTLKIEGAILDISITVLGVIYVGWLISYLISLRQLPFWGREYTYLVFITTWSVDNGAYVVGMTMGKHKAIPQISPHKSSEGMIGGIIGGFLAVLAAKWLFIPHLDYIHCLGIGLALGIIGQLGDLSESLLKRDAQVKDTSNFLPGHGGILDRFDSLLFTAPALYYYIKFLL